jgi:class 3 adenylate cyclase
MTPCPTCGTTNPERARFCAECGTALAPGADAPRSREVRKLVTVLFADAVGSTTLGEQLDPEVVRALMNRYFAVFQRVIEAPRGPP